MGENNKGVNISRLINRLSEEIEVEVITPLFLGGADNTKAELRIPSLKGVLRFWWRATCGITDLNRMKKKEGDIFGSTEQKASFSVFITDTKAVTQKKENLPRGIPYNVPGKTFKPGEIEYLAFGIRDHRAGYLRGHITPGSRFKIKLEFFNPDIRNDVLKSLQACIDFGGLGAKSRNGFGSLQTTLQKKYSIESNLKNPLVNHSALSKESLMFKTEESVETWDKAMSLIGKAYREARLNLEKKHHYEKRCLIAQPIVQAVCKTGRYAKPYYLHVKKLNDGQYQGQILFMPGKYARSEKHEEFLRTCKTMNAELAKYLEKTDVQ